MKSSHAIKFRLTNLLIVVFAISWLPSCTQDVTTTNNTPEEIAHSTEYLKYRQSIKDIARFVATHEIDFDAMSKVMNQYPKYEAKGDYPPELFSTIQNGEELQALMNERAGLFQKLNKRYQYHLLPDNLKEKIKDVYQIMIDKPTLEDSEIKDVIRNQEKG